MTHVFLSEHCQAVAAEGVPGQHLVIEIPSPAGSDRNVVIWMEGGDEPSLAFGNAGWHVHDANVRWREGVGWEEESLLDLLDAIRLGRVVVFVAPGREPVPFQDVLDLRDPDEPLDQLTCPVLDTDRILLRSFTGRGDREVTAADIED